ncbi:EamA domain-containing membrane protein RarD [Thomasclavelia cocleata]|uniref:EamA domain-containing membrane protein RarD n=2 Tax=Thomasclavelia cocleata TaxID=69824 RepID=A0A1I0F016_9FIRM|nr:DMT family transporter [Thomasclavelia cocleata]MCR1960336.1 DMT family transporter [Thomasclavelia cocleata]NDO42859.1 DMT family transporter [Thomasclavelia cocleata]SET51119.1 EamA domain-containing membrane protein RarD [Thomasclavelia cocleata]
MKNKEIFLLHLAVMLFGLAGIIGKFVSLPAVIVTFGRVFFSSIFLLIIILVKKEKIFLANKRDYALMIIAGVIMAIHWFTFLQTIQMSTVAIGTITFSTFPLFVTFLEPIIYKEKLRIKDIILALIIFLGILITIPEFTLDNQVTLAIIIGLMGSLSYAVLCLMNRYFSNRYSGRIICLYEQGIAAITLFPALFIVKAVPNATDLLALIFLGIICTALAHSIYVSSLKKVKVQTAGIISGMETVYSIVFAYILLKETLGVRELVGGIVILSVAFYASITSRDC